MKNSIFYAKDSRVFFIIVALISATALFLTTTAWAAPPGSPYNPGETLTPTCSPGDANCTVVTPAVSGANSDITSLTGLTTALNLGQGGTGMSTIAANKLLYTSALDTLAELSLDTTLSIIAGVLGVPDGSITEPKLDVLDLPADGEVLSWNNAGSQFEWIAVGGVASAIWDADSDTGIQAEEAADEDKLRFDTGGIERMVVDASGFDLNGSVNIDGELIKMNDTNASANNRIWFQIFNKDAVKKFEIGSIANGNSEVRFGDVNNTRLGFPASDPTYFAFINDVTEMWLGTAADPTLYFNYYNGTAEMHGRDINRQDVDYYVGTGAGGFSVDGDFSVGATDLFVDDSDGEVGIGTNAPTAELEIDGGLRLNPDDAAKPACDVNHRGEFWFTESGAGVADTLELCIKNAGDAYAWTTVL